jgi:hypothetical protein
MLFWPFVCADYAEVGFSIFFADLPYDSVDGSPGIGYAVYDTERAVVTQTHYRARRQGMANAGAPNQNSSKQ